MERPENRRFAGEPRDAISDDRGNYVAAAITIVRAYLEAGCPGVLQPLASFQDWSRLVRSALVWLGRVDPLETMEKVVRKIQEINGSYRCCFCMETSCPDRAFLSTNELKNSANINEEFRIALMPVVGGRGSIETVALGVWLSCYKNRIVGGFKIVSERDKHSKQNKWALISAGGAGGCGYYSITHVETVRDENDSCIESLGTLDTRNPPHHPQRLFRRG